MTIAATAWAFSTPLATTPLERLFLILIADSTDDFGVCVTLLEDVAATARVRPDEIVACVEALRSRGVLGSLVPVGRGDPDFDAFDVLFVSGWEHRQAMEVRTHADLGPVLRHHCYGWVAVQ